MSRSAAALLRPRLVELLAEIQAGRVPRELREPLCEHLALSLEAADGRAQSARDRSRERSEAVRGRIREALQAAPLTRPTTELVDVAVKRLGKTAPDLRTIKAEVLRLQVGIGMQSGSVYRSTIAST